MARRITVLTVLGTRPEVIKLAPVVRAMEADSGRFRSILCATGQHRELAEAALQVFDLRPNHNLAVMQADQKLEETFSRMLVPLTRLVRNEAPDYVLVQGDTLTTFAGALAGFFSQVPVVHVEAGLRTYDRYSPFPEEINRRLTTNLADIHFAPTVRNRQNLMKEGISPSRIVVTGNTVVDALYWVLENGPPRNADPRFANAGRIVLITCHRRESFGSGIKCVCEAIRQLAVSHQDVSFIYAVHPNPNVAVPVRHYLGSLPNVVLTQPLEYHDFVRLMARSELVLTDSGGIQEEAPSLGVAVVLLRDKTERPEGVEENLVVRVGTDSKQIVRGVSNLLQRRPSRSCARRSKNPYGDGHAAQRVLNTLIRFHGSVFKRVQPFKPVSLSGRRLQRAK